MNFQMFKLDLEKTEESEIKLPTSVGSSKKQDSSRKTSTSALLTMPKTDCVDHNKLWKILQEMGIPDYLTCLLRNLYAGQEAKVRTRHGKTGWFQTGKGVCKVCKLCKGIYCHPGFLTYVHSISFKILDWMKHKLETILPGEILIISDMQMTPPLWQKVKKS